MKKHSIDIITMGCAKNLIDSERLIKQLEAKGYTVEHNSERPSGEFVVVNTCGFIGDAKEESINMILNLTEFKKNKKIGNLIVMGCLSQRYLHELKEEIKEVDQWHGKFDWKKFVESVPDVSEKENSKPQDWERAITTLPWSAYIKISEGCDRYCAFCAIPYITGRHKSRDMEEILIEVSNLVSNGVREFNIIAQDLSSYGTDLYGVQKLPELIEKIANIKGVEWIRLHYLYPSDFPIGILDVMNKYDNVCKYLDIALQHISDPVLNNMNRKISKQETLSLLKTIRERVDGIHLRTTIMTGFPGEGKNEFQELLEFVKTQKFERLGGFEYSEENDTIAAKTLCDTVSARIKRERLDKIMHVQQEISEELNRSKIGTRLKVLVEEQNEDYAIGRSEFDSPEVDQEIIIQSTDLIPGSFIMVEIIDASPFELYATPILSK